MTSIRFSKYWGEFLIGDLFKNLSLKRIKPTFDKKNDVSTIRTDEFNLPLINAKSGNNGIMYYGREEDWEFAEMTLDIVNDGAISTGLVYAQPQKTGTLYNAYQIQLINRRPNYQELLFLQRCLQRSIQLKFNYYNKATWERVKQESIWLPLIDRTDPANYTQTDIDWNFMENYIKQLEADRLQQLEAYLIATGLDDYVLNDKDKKTLSLSQVDISDEVRYSKNIVEDEQLRFKEFQIDDLFVKKKLGHKKPFTKAKDTSDHKTKEFNLPLINAKMGDNGIMFYGRSQDFDHIEKSIAIIQNGAIATGKVYVQPQHTGVLWDGYLIQSNFEVDKECRRLFYIATCIEKTIRPIFNRDNKATWNRIKGYKIKLPVTDDNTLDFEYMENYIRAIEKLTIKDVVEYKDKTIALTKEII